LRIIVHIFWMTLCTHLNFLLMLFFHVCHILVLILLIICLLHNLLSSFWNNLLLISNASAHLPFITIISRMTVKREGAFKILEWITTTYNIGVLWYLRYFWSVVRCKTTCLVYRLWIIFIPVGIDMKCLSHEIVLIFLWIMVEARSLIKILIINLTILIV